MRHDGCNTTQRLLPFYVNGSLEGDEAASVRAHVESCDRCRGEMADLLRLARAVEEHGTALSAEQLRAAPRAGFRLAPWLATAAAIAVIAGGLWPFLNRGGKSPDRSAEPFVLDLGSGPERGEDRVPVFVPPRGDGPLKFVFFVPVTPDARYAADLMDAGGQVLAHAGTLGPPDSLGRLSWTVPGRLLQAAGEHEIVVERKVGADDRRIYRYAFRVDTP